MTRTGAPPARSKRSSRGTRPSGISKALAEVLERARIHLEANERAEVARHVRLLIDRSGLANRNSRRASVWTPEDLAAYLDGSISPSAVADGPDAPAVGPVRQGEVRAVGRIQLTRQRALIGATSDTSQSLPRLVNVTRSAGAA